MGSPFPSLSFPFVYPFFGDAEAFEEGEVSRQRLQEQGWRRRQEGHIQKARPQPQEQGSAHQKGETALHAEDGTGGAEGEGIRNQGGEGGDEAHQQEKRTEPSRKGECRGRGIQDVQARIEKVRQHNFFWFWSVLHETTRRSWEERECFGGTPKNFVVM